ncbi:MAG: DUF2723 domain-containing protein [Acidobacteriota bacterium]
MEVRKPTAQTSTAQTSTAQTGTPPRDLRRACLVASLAGLLAFCLYASTAAPTVYGLDSAELTTAAASGGLLRAPGYPVYLMLGGLWSHVWRGARLPGDAGRAMNLMSAFAGSMTIALLTLLLTHSLGLSTLATLGAVGLLAVAKYFWAMSSIAEVYTLQTALMAGTLLLFLHWRRRPSWQRLALATFALAVSAGNQTAAVLLVPGLVLLVLMRRPRTPRDSASLVAATVAGLAGLAVYLYLPLTAAGEPAFNYAGHYLEDGTFQPLDLSQPAQLWWLVSGRSFAGLMFDYPPAELAVELGRLGRDLWNAFFVFGLGPAVLGLIVQWRRDRGLALPSSAMFAVHALFFASYRVIDKSTMFLPCYLILAIWLATGYHEMLSWLRSSAAARRLLQALILGIVVLSAAWTHPQVDLSEDRSARQEGEAALALAAPGALIISAWSLAPILDYLQIIEGKRPDVTSINLFLLGPESAQAWVDRELPQRPVYVDRRSLALLSGVEGRQRGPLYELSAASAGASSSSTANEVRTNGPTRRSSSTGSSASAGGSRGSSET